MRGSKAGWRGCKQSIVDHNDIQDPASVVATASVTTCMYACNGAGRGVAVVVVDGAGGSELFARLSV